MKCPDCNGKGRTQIGTFSKPCESCATTGQRCDTCGDPCDDYGQTECKDCIELGKMLESRIYRSTSRS